MGNFWVGMDSFGQLWVAEDSCGWLRIVVGDCEWFFGWLWVVAYFSITPSKFDCEGDRGGLSQYMGEHGRV